MPDRRLFLLDDELLRARQNAVSYWMRNGHVPDRMLFSTG